MQQLAHWFVYVLARFSEWVVRSIPPGAALRVADFAGTVWYVVDRRRRKRAMENVRVVYGETLPTAERRKLVFASFRSMARVPIEAIWIPRLFASRVQVARRCRIFGDLDVLIEHLENGPPCILFTGHIGNWEVAAQTIRAYPAPFKALARPIDNPVVERLSRDSRGGGSNVVAKKGGMAAVLHALRRGYWVGIVGDQNAGGRADFIPFFGIPAATSIAPAYLACREGVPFLMGACLRRPGRVMEFDLHFTLLEHPQGPDVTKAEILDLAARSMTTLEQWIAIDPRQYNWIHRRWKSRPKGEANGPHLPQYDHRKPQPPLVPQPSP